MPTGDTRARARRPPPPRPGRGYTYLLLLFLVALAGAALAALGEQWQVAAQRERETELLFRGTQIREALQRFHDQTPTGAPALPQGLEELLVDRRWPTPRQHLRRLYTDPFTGQTDWLLLRNAQGGIVGLRSRSTLPALRRQGVPLTVTAPATPNNQDAASTANGPPRVGDWLFSIQPRSAAPRRRT